MTAGHFNPSVTLHISRSGQPITGRVGEVTGTAAIDTAVKGTSVGAYNRTALGIISAFIGKLVVRYMDIGCRYFTGRYGFSVQPAVTFGQ